MKVEDLSKEEQATLKEWERVRRSWWLYTPAQLRKLESEVAKIYEKLDRK